MSDGFPVCASTYRRYCRAYRSTYWSSSVFTEVIKYCFKNLNGTIHTNKRCLVTHTMCPCHSKYIFQGIVLRTEILIKNLIFIFLPSTFISDVLPIIIFSVGLISAVIVIIMEIKNSDHLPVESKIFCKIKTICPPTNIFDRQGIHCLLNIGTITHLQIMTLYVSCFTSVQVFYIDISQT
jgi:hypothetical protein